MIMGKKVFSPLATCYRENTLEAGCDEAGRGCLAGPVVAAAVVLPIDFHHPDLNDSKQLSEKRRDELRIVIEKEALSFGVGFVYEKEIDEINILNASFLAMHRAVDKLKMTPDLLLIDGNRFNPYEDIEHVCVVKGDAKYLSIAAASILAKTYRDEYMLRLHREHPLYQWNKNKGYPTQSHRKAIQDFGVTDVHRKSFNLLPPPTFEFD